MLDLQTGVDLKKIELLGFRIVHELAGARGAISGRLTQSSRRFVEPLTNRLRQAGRRSFFENLLISALRRAVAFAQYRHSPPSISKNLHLHMACRSNELFQEQAGRLEVALGQPLNALEFFFEFISSSRQLHADPSSSRGALDHHRESRCARLRSARRPGNQGGPNPGETGTPLAIASSRAVCFRPKSRMFLRRRPDEGDSRRFACLGKIGVFTEKSVSWVNPPQRPSCWQPRGSSRPADNFARPAADQRRLPRPAMRTCAAWASASE